MSWKIFWDSVGAFFSDVGATFLTNLKASLPVAEQAVSNILTAIVDAIVAGIESGAIPLPALASDKSAISNSKRNTAFNATKEKLSTTTIPNGMVISDSMIYWQIETSYQKLKTIGNQGNFPGGNSGPEGK